MGLPQQYKWLLTEGGPKTIVEALKLYGTYEAPGTSDNPTILSWAKELGLTDYTHDSIAWCGLFASIVARRAGKEIPAQPLWALNWAKFGQKVSEPMLGDILVFKREGGGHVTFYVGEDAQAYHCLGGNQGDQVNIIRISKSRLYQACRAIYNVQPPNVRKIYLSSQGQISTNEA